MDMSLSAELSHAERRDCSSSRSSQSGDGNILCVFKTGVKEQKREGCERGEGNGGKEGQGGSEGNRR